MRIGNILSEEAGLRSGVPQGSVMGPLLFLIFISDLGQDLDEGICRILKYVDDSKILAEANNFNEVESLQENLNKIYCWATKNSMKWNSLKFQMLRLGRNQEFKDSTFFFTPEYSDIIEHKEVIKDLGVMVDDKLS